jgi:DNA-binding transcriptional LysR family regulator
MTLEQLRIFVAVAERQHVTEAAKALRLTQSAVSAAVSALEARHAVKLFDRIGRRIALTEAGRRFLVEARAVLARSAAAEAMLDDLVGLKRGALKIAASQTVANYWLPPLLSGYRAAYPGIALSLVIGNSEQVRALIHDGTVDLGFVEDAIEDPLLAAEPVAEDALLVVARSVPVPKKTGTAAQIRQLAWVFREPGSGTRAIFEQALTAFGVARSEIRIALELPSNEAVRSAVECGAGAAALSRLVVASSLKAGTLVALDIPLPKRLFFMLRHRKHSVTQAERALHRIVTALPRAASVSTGRRSAKVGASR